MKSKYSSPVLAITSDPLDSTKYKLDIKNSNFRNNSAEKDSGVIHAKNVDVTIKDTEFLGNKALQGSAGALYLECDKTSVKKCIYDISDTRFTEN